MKYIIYPLSWIKQPDGSDFFVQARGHVVGPFEELGTVEQYLQEQEKLGAESVLRIARDGCAIVYGREPKPAVEHDPEQARRVMAHLIGSNKL